MNMEIMERLGVVFLGSGYKAKDSCGNPWVKAKVYQSKLHPADPLHHTFLTECL